MREIVSPLDGIRSPLGSVSLLALYAVLGFKPKLVLDFDDERYFDLMLTPTTFSDLITHSASSNATMVDSDGLLKWRPHNLLTYSEDLTNGVWLNAANSNATRLGHDTTITAENGYFYIRQNATFPAVKHTLVFNATANVAVSDASFRADGDSPSITNQSFSAGETRTIIISDYVPFSSSVQFGVDMRSGGSASGFTISIDKVHLYRPDLGGMVNNPDRGDSYVPTTSSAVYLPRRGHHIYNGTSWVNEGLLHESEARTNLWGYSTPVLTDFPTRAGAIADATCAFDVFTAPGIAYTTAGVSSYAYRQFTLTGQHTFSVFVELDDASAPVFGSLSPTSNLNDFVMVLESGVIDPTTYSIQKMGASTYRVSGVGTGTGVSGNFGVLKYNTNSSRTFKVTGYQLEAGSTPSSYIPTSGATVTRAAETLTIPSAKLPWPTPNVIGPELVTNGTFDTDTSGWTNTSATLASVGGELQVSNQSASPANSTQTFSGLTIGSVYKVSATYRQEGSGGIAARISFFGAISPNNNTATPLTAEIYVVATSTTATLNLASFGTASTVSYFDNISVREIDPLAVSIQMQGRMTYADENETFQTMFVRWLADSSNLIYLYNNTSIENIVFRQHDSGVVDSVNGPTYSPGINVPFNIASRHGSTFINGAVDGTALTANTTPTALADLSATDLSLGHDYMGTIKMLRIWADDLGDTGIAEASS